VAGQALLLSKDRHILSMTKRLRALGVMAQAVIRAIAFEEIRAERPKTGVHSSLFHCK
jgi:hypothetical protein